MPFAAVCREKPLTSLHAHFSSFLSDCTQPWQHFSSFRRRTRCATWSTPRISTPSPPRLSPKQHQGAKRPLQAGTYRPPPILPPASPLKVEYKTPSWNEVVMHIAPEQWWMLWSGKMLNEVHLLELFFIGIDVFPLLQHAQDTSLSWRSM